MVSAAAQADATLAKANAVAAEARACRLGVELKEANDQAAVLRSNLAALAERSNTRSVNPDALISPVAASASDMSA